MHELAHRAEVTHVLGALAFAGVAPLLLKGTALAYSHYLNPVQRPRGDTDLLIPISKRNDTALVLEKLGYLRSQGIDGEFISYQATWGRLDKLGASHSLDVHWRINNSQVLAKTLSYDELASRAVPLPALGPSARALAPVDALLFACIHRAGHVNAPYYVDGTPHFGIDRLIWLYDMHLLVSQMAANQLDDFVRLAQAKRISAICRDALVLTHKCYATPISSDVLEALSCPTSVEPSAHFLHGKRMRLMVEDFRAFDDWHSRIGWVRETAFPSVRYMRSKYPDAAISWMPILYIRRGLAGIARLILPRNTESGH